MKGPRSTCTGRQVKSTSSARRQIRSRPLYLSSMFGTGARKTACNSSCRLGSWRRSIPATPCTSSDRSLEVAVAEGARAAVTLEVGAAREEEESVLCGSIRCSRSRMSSSGSHTNQAPSRATRRTSWAFAALPAHHQPSACCTQTGYDDGRSSVARTAWHTSLRPRAMDEVAAEAMVLTRQGYAAAALAMTVATQPDWARALGTAQHGQTAEAATAAAEEDSVLRGSIRCSRSRMSSSGSHTSQAPWRATHRTSWGASALPAHHQH